MFLSSCLGVCLCFCCWFCIFIYLSGENIKVRAKGHRQRAAVVGVLVAQWCNVSISSTPSTKKKKKEVLKLRERVRYSQRQTRETLQPNWPRCLFNFLLFNDKVFFFYFRAPFDRWQPSVRHIFRLVARIF